MNFPMARIQTQTLGEVKIFQGQELHFEESILLVHSIDLEGVWLKDPNDSDPENIGLYETETLAEIIDEGIICFE
jgi:hypothetical protein